MIEPIISHKDSDHSTNLITRIFQALPHPILFLDHQLRVQILNHAAENFLNISQSVIKGKALTNFIPIDSPIIALSRQVIADKIPISEYRLNLNVCNKPEAHIIDINAVPSLDDNNGLILMLLVRTTAETIDRQFVHQTSARSIDGLTTILMHEIKNPLFAIQGAAQLLEDAGKQDIHILADLIRDETDRIIRLTDRMDIFSDAINLKREPINIHQILEKVKLLAQASFAKDIKITEQYDPSLPLIYANQDQFIQVFLNLVKNAAEALERTTNPEIALCTTFRPGLHISLPATRNRLSLPLEFRVEDNGQGISDDIQPHLFDPFVTTKHKGTGLGLALVAKLIHDHSGIIECERRNSKTIFRILMPAYQNNLDSKNE